MNSVIRYFGFVCSGIIILVVGGLELNSLINNQLISKCNGLEVNKKYWVSKDNGELESTTLIQKIGTTLIFDRILGHPKVISAWKIVGPVDTDTHVVEEDKTVSYHDDRYWEEQGYKKVWVKRW